MTWEILLDAFQSDDSDRWLAALVMAHSMAVIVEAGPEDLARSKVLQRCRDLAAWLGEPAWSPGRYVLIRAHRWALNGAT